MRNLSGDGFVYRIQTTSRSYGLTSSSSFYDFLNHTEWRALSTSLHSTLSKICIMYFTYCRRATMECQIYVRYKWWWIWSSHYYLWFRYIIIWRGWVSVIIFICGYHTIVYIILVPFNVYYRQNIVDEVRALHNFSGSAYCTHRNKGIKQMCPSGTEVSYEIGRCVNKTSKWKKENSILICSHLYCFSKYISIFNWISMCFTTLSKWWCLFWFFGGWRLSFSVSLSI